jgi:ketosteroid isomerase-like protein
MWRAVIATLAVLALAGPPAAGSSPRGNAETITAATTYLEAYQALDLARLQALYTENATFDDPTSLRVRGIGGPFVWRGRNEILTGIRSWTKSISSLRYDIDDVYEASGRVVFIGAVNPAVATPNGPTQFRYRIVTIVTVEGGRISEHRDYTDYAGATQGAAPTP